MSKSLTGIAIILFFLALGDVASYYLLPVIPGSIIGMGLLFAALQLKLVREEPLEKVVGFIMKNLSLLFLAPAVGIIDAIGLLGHNLLSISVAIVASTALTMVAVGWTKQLMARRKGTERLGMEQPAAKPGDQARKTERRWGR